MITNDMRGIAGYIPSWLVGCGPNPALNDVLTRIDEAGQPRMNVVFSPSGDSYGDFLADGVADYQELAEIIAAYPDGVSLFMRPGEFNITTPGNTHEFVFGSNNKIEGAGVLTKLFDNFELLEAGKSTFRVVGSNNMIRDFYLRGTTDGQWNGVKSGATLNIRGNSLVDQAENNHVSHMKLVGGDSGVIGTYLKDSSFHDLNIYNTEHALVISKSQGININNIQLGAVPTIDGLATNFMKRGIHIQRNCERINVNNIVYKAYETANCATVFLIAAEDDQGEDDNILHDININNVNIDGLNETTAPTFAFFITAFSQSGVDNININNTVVRLNEGDGIAFEQHDDITGDYRFGTIRVTNSYFSTADRSNKSNRAVFDIRAQTGGGNEPPDNCIDTLIIENCTFTGERPGRFWRIKNLIFKNCTFIADGADGDGVTVKDVQNIFMSGCTFDASTTGAVGRDIRFSTGITGTVIVENCIGVKGNVLIDPSVAALPNVLFRNNQGFGDYNNYGNFIELASDQIDRRYIDILKNVSGGTEIAVYVHVGSADGADGAVHILHEGNRNPLRLEKTGVGGGAVLNIVQNLGTGADIQSTLWSILKSGKANLAALRLNAIASKTSAYPLTSEDFFIGADAALGGFTLTLPSAATVTGQLFFIQKRDVTANVVTIAAQAGENINGAASVTLSAQYKSYLLYSLGGVNWAILAAV